VTCPDGMGGRRRPAIGWTTGDPAGFAAAPLLCGGDVGRTTEPLRGRAGATVARRRASPRWSPGAA